MRNINKREDWDRNDFLQMPVKFSRGSGVAVSAYFRKKTTFQYRMVFVDFPAVLNYIFTPDAELADYEGTTYKISIEQVQ